MLPRQFQLPWLLLLLPLVIAVQEARAQGAEYFLDIPDIPGSATDADYQGQICITSFSWGVEVPPAATTGGTRNRGTPEQQYFLLGKNMDIASPNLFNAVTSQRAYPEVTLTLVQANGSRAFRYVFEDVTFEQVETGADDSGVLREVIGLRATQVEITHYEQNAAGAEISSYRRFYNFATNTGG